MLVPENEKVHDDDGGSCELTLGGTDEQHNNVTSYRVRIHESRQRASFESMRNVNVPRSNVRETFTYGVEDAKWTSLFLVPVKTLLSDRYNRLSGERHGLSLATRAG